LVLAAAAGFLKWVDESAHQSDLAGIASMQAASESTVALLSYSQISTMATVPAAASVSATENHAVVLVFVDRTLTMGNAAPTNTASSVRVTLDKIDGRWLISQFDPI
jgi:Mce-associated membrane protein